MKNSLFKKILFTLIAGFLIFLTIYTVNDGHNLEINNKVVDDIYSAVISIILGALVTMTLLYAQTMNEDSHTKNSEIFKEKLRIYREFLESLGDFTKDGKLDKSEIRLLIVKHALLNMNLSEVNRNLLNDSISKIKDDLFFENENSVPDYKALGELFNEIANIFRADLYDEKISTMNSLSYENFFEISNTVRSQTIFKDSFDDFIKEISPGREMFFTVKLKDESKSYKFKVLPDAATHYTLAYKYVLSITKELNLQIETKFEVAYKKLYKSLAINNPKILFIYNEKIVMRIGITNRNRVALQFLDDDKNVGMHQLESLEGIEINEVNIQDYIPKNAIKQHLLSCIKEIDSGEEKTKI